VYTRATLWANVFQLLSGKHVALGFNKTAKITISDARRVRCVHLYGRLFVFKIFHLYLFTNIIDHTRHYSTCTVPTHIQEASTLLSNFSTTHTLAKTILLAKQNKLDIRFYEKMSPREANYDQRSNSCCPTDTQPDGDVPLFSVVRDLFLDAFCAFSTVHKKVSEVLVVSSQIILVDYLTRVVALFTVL
jgi:hypothetical protein